MSVAVLIDIPDSFLKETKYVLENLFFPFNEDVFVISKSNLKDQNEFNRYRKKVVYCHEESSLLSNIAEDKGTIYIVLEKYTIDYFSKFRRYNTDNILFSNGMRNKVPCLFPLRKNFKNSTQPNIFKFDLFAASFFFLSCWQEYTITERDAHGRFLLQNSIQYKLGVCDIPVVNEYLKIFEKYARDIWDIELEYVKLPVPGDLYIALSHDIDFIDWSLKKYIDILRINRLGIEMGYSGLFNIIKNVFSKKAIFQKIKNIELTHGVTSTNYFFSSYPGNHQSFFHNLIKSLENANFEVGHHISKSLDSDIAFKKDKAMFESLVKKTYGERVHMLKFEINKLFSQLEKCSYCYDNSLLFPEDMSYRTGFSYPHYLFDPFHKRPFNVLAIPLNIMDSTLVEGKYLDLNDTSSESEILSFVDKAITYGGVLSILIHHNFFWINTEKRLQIYDNLLKYFTKSNIKVGTCRDIYFWYKEKSSKVKINTV